jgi:CDP-L-myo-inositol myo-inositolphosphotransferase
MEGVYDGYVSRYLNRKLSDPLSRLLARTPLTPNQVTWAAFAVAALAFAGFLAGQNIVAGLLVQLSSIIDGVDGGLARLKGMTSAFGGFLDSVLDRYADTLIILGLTLWSVWNESYPGIWVVGFLAMAGTICLSYTRARVDSSHRRLFDRGVQSIASRDVRLLLIAAGAVAGQAYFCLIAIAALTNLTAFYRVLYLHRYLNRAAPLPVPGLERHRVR